MDVLAAVVAGAAAKIYDDSVDTGLLTDEYQKKILETLQCFLLGGLSINNFRFTLIILIINIAHHLTNKEAFKEPYEWSLLSVYPIFLILSFTTREYLPIFDLFIFISMSVTLFIEPLFVKEETSYQKLVMRSIASISGILFCYILAPYLTRGTYLLFIYCISYLIISSLFQAYSISSLSTKKDIHDILHTCQDGISALRVDLASVLSLSLPPSIEVTTA
jgi:hypothetical protein